MSAVSKSPYVTPEEYLARERLSETKHEYFNGYVFAMSGVSRAHNVITVNTSAELRTQLKGTPCESYAMDMRVKVSTTGLYTYPDLVVVCGVPRFDDNHVDTLLNPQVLMEVLSPSTEAYDRGDKFAHYRRLESLQEFVLISQDRVRVEHFLRQGDQWVILTELTSFDDFLVLSSIDCRISLREIYDRIEFPTPPERIDAQPGPPAKS